MADAIKNRFLIPRIKSSLATKSCAVRPVKSWSTACGGRAVAMTAPTIASPIDCPVDRMVLRVPEATPSLLRSTELMTARVFGEENRPNPTPSKVSLKTMSLIEDVMLSCDSVSNPTVTMTMPAELSNLEPNLSDSHPLNGESSAIATDIAIKNSPALSG